MVKHRPIWQTSRLIAMQPTHSESTAGRSPIGEAAPATPAQPQPASTNARAPREIGGREGPDPTRYGDWEKNGRCIDF
jgi:hypothetical protein